jgi:hypothetical protein
MERDVAVTFNEGVTGEEKNAVLKRLIGELCHGTDTAVDTSSIPRLFGTDADSTVLAEAYERLPARDRAKIERVRIFEDAA